MALENLESFVRSEYEKTLETSIDNNILAMKKFSKDYSNKNIYRERILESFKATGDFTATRANLSMDTTNYLTGTGALSIASTSTSANTAISKTVSLDLSNDTNFELKIYLADHTLLSNIYLYFLTSAGSTFYQQWNCNALGKDGWNTIRFAKESLTSSGTVAWTDTFKTLQINTNPTGTAYTTVVIDSLKANIKEPAYFVFMLDDGKISTYNTVKPILDQYGYKGCSAVYGSVIGTSGYMDVNHLKDLYNAGWDILNHSQTHTDYTSASYTATAKDIQDMQIWLEDNGFTRGIDDIFIYPTTYSAMGRQVVSDLGFKLARGAIGAINYSNPPDLLNLESLPASLATTLASVKSYVDKLVYTGGLIIFYTHDVSASPSSIDWSTDNFRSLVEYVAEKKDNIKVVTMTEYYDLMFK